MKKITSRLLRKHGACSEQVKKFIALGGNEKPLTRELCIKHAHDLDFQWAAENLLTPSALAEYERVRATALAEYERVCAPARAEYERVCATALAEYERVRAPAWAEYKRFCATALAEYERVRAPARAEYERVCAPAWAEYGRVRAGAFFDAWTNQTPGEMG